MTDSRPQALNGRTTLDGAGSATLTFNGPQSLATRALGTIVVTCSSSTPRPNVSVYRGIVAPHRLMAYSRLGDNDTFIADGEVLESGEPLLIVWNGGLAGATVYANVNATDTVG